MSNRVKTHYIVLGEPNYSNPGWTFVPLFPRTRGINEYFHFPLFFSVFVSPFFFSFLFPLSFLIATRHIQPNDRKPLTLGPLSGDPLV